MSKWKTVKLEEILNFYNGKEKKILQFGEYPVYGSNGILGLHNEYNFEEGIIIGRVGAYCGSININISKFWSSDNTIVVQPKTKQSSNLNFLYYMLQTMELNNYAGGSAQPLLTQRVLKKLKTQIPDLETQGKIADVLSTYDELIENNNRRIEILEKTAEEIYKEWFVRMRFPGHENTKFVKGIPEEWQVRKIGEVANLVHGYTESANDEAIGPKYLRGTDINKRSYINWNEVPYCKIEDGEVKKYKLYINDIVIIRMADPGKVAIIERDIDSVFASYLIKIDYDHNKVKPYYMFYTLYSDGYQEHIKSFSNGTTRSSINSKMILSSKILVPNIQIQEKFNNKISTIRNMLNELIDINQNLIKQRDLLLPRLMNGTIEVK